jgi:hypothetical protein
MPEAASYAAIEVLRDGTRVDIRALRPDDRAAILAAVDHTSERSLYRRFFAARRSFSEREIAFFLNVDLISHVALVAVVRHDDGGEEIRRRWALHRPAARARRGGLHRGRPVSGPGSRHRAAAPSGRNRP